ncbi:hypothetical protein J6590_024242 [Homalodisca vitripennis]|nr:hypothetical protein J6590_024242 [Homalodisca vitripennis]
MILILSSTALSLRAPCSAIARCSSSRRWSVKSSLTGTGLPFSFFYYEDLSSLAVSEIFTMMGLGLAELWSIGEVGLV